MTYEPYVNAEYYTQIYYGTLIPTEKLRNALKQASRHIDTLTYNRIVGRGICKLTDFQQDIIKEVICKQADFEYENKDMISSILTGYSLNGVSMQIGNNWNIHIEKGVIIQKETYALLCQTGLCCRLAVK